MRYDHKKIINKVSILLNKLSHHLSVSQLTKDQNSNKLRNH